MATSRIGQNGNEAVTGILATASYARLNSLRFLSSAALQKWTDKWKGQGQSRSVLNCAAGVGLHVEMTA